MIINTNEPDIIVPILFYYIGIYAEINSRDGMYMKLCSRRGCRLSLLFYSNSPQSIAENIIYQHKNYGFTKGIRSELDKEFPHIPMDSMVLHIFVGK